MAGNPKVEQVVEQVRGLNEQIVSRARQGGEDSLRAYKELLENLAEAEEAAGDRTAEWVQAFARAQASFTRELAEAFPSLLQRISGGVAGVAGSAADQARKVPGAKTAEGEAKGAVSREQELPIKDYDDLNAADAVKKLDGLSATDLGKIDAYERRTKNRKTVLDRIQSLR
ncbi:hypothetical protein Acsp06_37050 [Actinomycetospora sp. NBRC 106375]|uniref:hypothetical protein n=1 Tax=Actinomycetospora sp. NBRC 106375 TaxID=3032207 RepID=UPI0024A51FBA|nr:hypothetical protein [Actinomycetospora sp. NBRC 106375]GLZ47520.1 hypothetical protein Acsp06_37050 [Actinomycetospora sp. NBRC 106375]